MILIDCKSTIFSLHLFVYFFENVNIFSWSICTYHFTRKNDWRVPQGLIIGKPISQLQYASYSAMVCLLLRKDSCRYSSGPLNPNSATATDGNIDEPIQRGCYP